MKRRRVKEQLLKAGLPRLSTICDGRYAVDFEDGVTVLLKHDNGRLLIDVEDGIRLAYWRDENDLCHVTIERERQQQKKVAA
jgi:hypothetical protein